MMIPFAVGLRFVLHGYGSLYAGEGGFVDNPRDPGGATNFGVTQAVYDAHREACGEARQSVRLIALAEVCHIYENGYWVPEGCPALPLPFAVAVFDTAVNGGDSRARHLRDEVPHAAPLAMALSLCDLREAWYRSLVNEREFLEGWLNRVNALRAYVSNCAG